MPTTPYASVLLAVNGGAAAAGTVVAVADDVIQCSTLSTIGWKTSNLPTVWQITTYPDGWVADAGWVLNVVTEAYEYTVGGATGMLPPPITMPSAAEIAAGLWGKWKVRLLVNGGGGQLTDWTAGISVLSQTGLEDVAVSEGTEFDATRKWVGAFQRAQRIWDAAIAAGVGGGVSLGAGTPAVLTAAAGTGGALLTAAPFDHRHQVSTAICVTIGAANSIGVSTSLAKADHVHDHGALLGGDRHAIAVAGVSHGFISATSQTKLDGIEAGAQVTSFARVKTALGLASSAVDFNTQKLTGVAAGSSATDAVNFSQLNAIANGMRLKAAVRGATTGNISLSGSLTDDGVTYATDDRILALYQTDQTQNGIYDVDTAGAWSRSADANEDSEIQPGTMVFVLEGTANGNTGWAILSDAAITVGVSNIVFTQVFGPGAYIAGAGLTQSGNTFNVGAGAGIQVNANDVAVIYGAGGDLTTVNAGDTASAGSIDKAARADHQHPVSTAAAGTATVGSSAAEGAATSLARSDHAHAFPAPAAPANVTKAAADAGAATTFARADHKHDVTTAAPSPPAVTVAEGSASSLSRSDHVHAWGAAGTGLALNRPQHASGAGIKDSIRGQAAAAGAYAGGKQELGGGAAGDSTAKNGDTLIVLGLAPTGGTSAAVDISSSDGGTSYLNIAYSDTLAKTVLSSGGKVQMSMSVRHASTLSHTPFAETNAATVTMAEGKSIRRRVTITQNTTFANPTGFEDGTELILFIKQGASPPWTASWGANFTFPTGLSGTLAGSALNDVDVFRFLLEIDKWVCVTHYNYAG